MADCFACTNNDRIDALPPREAIAVAGAWRVAHAFGTSLPGWLVVVPRRHVTALHEMDAEDAAALGAVLFRVSKALCELVGCEKTYFVFFAEADGFEHLHVHVIPRMPWFTEQHRGPAVFSLLGVRATEEVSEPERDRLAIRIREAMK